MFRLLAWLVLLPRTVVVGKRGTDLFSDRGSLVEAARLREPYESLNFTSQTVDKTKQRLAVRNIVATNEPPAERLDVPPYVTSHPAL